MKKFDSLLLEDNIDVEDIVVGDVIDDNDENDDRNGILLHLNCVC